MSFTAFFDGPSNYKNKFDFYEQGGSPFLLEKFIETIEAQKDEIEEINISWYLYNNRFLHDYLKSLSEKGIVINVITIPLEGYDNSKPQILENLKTGERRKEKVTKYSIAKEIFSEMYNSEDCSNFNMYFFSHLYVRSKYVNKFSRGSLPYSLHLKSAYIKKKTGYMIIMSSSNLAVRDLVKYESLICIQDEESYEEAFKNFYIDLINNSINIKDYNSTLNTTCNSFDFIDYTSTRFSFIASPFYNNSANNLDLVLSEHILNAKERIIICAQHLAAYNYQFNAKYHSAVEEDQTRKGVLGIVIAMAKKGLAVTCISQTFVPPTAQAHEFENIKFRSPANTNNFKSFYAELALTENAAYFVNENMHSKFIIIDNKLIYCSYNFTPTQFIYLDKVDIPTFRNMPDVSYKGIHCEVSAHVVIENEDIVNSFLDNLETIKKLEETVRVL